MLSVGYVNGLWGQTWGRHYDEEQRKVTYLLFTLLILSRKFQHLSFQSYRDSPSILLLQFE